MNILEKIIGPSRKVAFGLLLVPYMVLGLYAPVWPVWDYFESAFVAKLLQTMIGDQDSSGAWYGARVQGDDTVLVAGLLHAQKAPRDPETEVVYEDCVIMRRDIEKLGLDLSWKLTERRVFKGEDIRIAGWRVDPDFMRSAVVPATLNYRHSWDDRKVRCPENKATGSKVLCRYAEYCVTSGYHTILGVVGKPSGGMPVVAMPNATLVDYPLTQRGILAPREFAMPYRFAMRERTPVYPQFIAMVQIVVSAAILMIVNGALEKAVRESFDGQTFKFRKVGLLWFNNHISFVRIIFGLILGPLIQQRKNLSSVEWRTTICGLGAPIIPLVAYYLMTIDFLFFLAGAIYILAVVSFMMLSFAWFRRGRA